MYKIIAIIVACLVATSVIAQSEWKLRKDEDGIKVFTTNGINSNFKSVKVECTVKARLSQLVAFLLDIERQHEWVYSNYNGRLLKKYGDNELAFYSEVSVPWPCTDRDYIAHFTMKQVSPQLLTIDSHAESGLLPEKAGRIRVKFSNAHWDVTTVNHDLLKIVYVVQFDPAGSVPAWLTNLFVTKAPFQTFEKLREGAADPRYQNAHLSFIKE
jgi:hypothetical protein